MTTVLDSAKGVAEDIFYVGIGVGVIAFQKAQVKRQELKGKFSKPIEDVEKQRDEIKVKLIDNVLRLDDSLDKAIEGVGTFFEPVEQKLPESLRDVVTKAKGFSKDSRYQLRQILVSAK